MFGASFTLGSVMQNSDPDPELEQVRERFLAGMIDRGTPARQVARLLDTVRPDGTWPGIDYADTSKTGFEHEHHLANLHTLAQAHRRPGTRYSGDAQVRATALAAFDFWITNDFICENWWWNEMGTPGRLIDIMLLLQEELSPAQVAAGLKIVGRASRDGFGFRPGGDSLPILGIIGRRALFERDAHAFSEIVASMAELVAIAEGRGIQPDFSHHHRRDRVTTTLTYGHGFATAFATYAEKLAGTRFQFAEPTLALLVDFYLDGIHASTAQGRFLDPQQLNRGLTRQSGLRPLAATVPLRLAAATRHRAAELEELIAVREGRREPAFRFNRFFWCSEYLTHQRPGWFASVRMFSIRNHSVEMPYNDEGLLNHFLADGANFIVRTGSELAGVPPVLDWRKVPGTTVVQKPSMPPAGDIQQRGRTGFVGGVSDGLHGAAVFDHDSPLDSLQAKKAWFFFDDGFVCLGAGISSAEEYPVATTLNQMRLTGEVILDRQGQATALPAGEHDLGGAQWVWHDGTAYAFPAPAAARLRNAIATGTWRRINHQSWATDAEVALDTFTLWVDHGVRPVGAEYAYLVIPGVAADSVADHPFRKQVEILANTPHLQAVRHRGEGLVQVVFHAPGSIEILPGVALTSDQACLVMVHTVGASVSHLTVADPGRELTTAQFQLAERAAARPAGPAAADGPTEARTTRLRVDLPRGVHAGKSARLELPRRRQGD